MIVTTTNSIPGKRIEIVGTVHKEAVFGANFIKDFFASAVDTIGGRSKSYEKILAKGRNVALDEIEKQAVTMGANGIIGLNMDFEFTQKMIAATAYGTAVKFG